MVGRFGGSEQRVEVLPGGLFMPRPRCRPGHGGGVNLGGLREAGCQTMGWGPGQVAQGVPREGGRFGGHAGATCRIQGLEEVYGHPGPGDSNPEPRTALRRENPRRGWEWGDARVPEPPLRTGAPRRKQGGARAPAGRPEGEREVGTWGSRALGLSQTAVIRESFKLGVRWARQGGALEAFPCQL